LSSSVAAAALYYSFSGRAGRSVLFLRQASPLKIFAAAAAAAAAVAAATAIHDVQVAHVFLLLFNSFVCEMLAAAAAGG
jgi:uncharacterized membrane protein YhaH (DUF805 family)